MYSVQVFVWFLFRLTVDLALWESLVPQTGLTSEILNRCKPQAMQAMYSYNPEPYTLQAFGTMGVTSGMFTSVRAPATLVPVSATCDAGAGAGSPEQLRLRPHAYSDDDDDDSDSDSDIARVHDDTHSDRSSSHHMSGACATGDERPSLMRNSDLDPSDYPKFGTSTAGHSIITYALPLIFCTIHLEYNYEYMHTSSCMYCILVIAWTTGAILREWEQRVLYTCLLVLFMFYTSNVPTRLARRCSSRCTTRRS